MNGRGSDSLSTWSSPQHPDQGQRDGDMTEEWAPDRLKNRRFEEGRLSGGEASLEERGCQLSLQFEVSCKGSVQFLLAS